MPGASVHGHSRINAGAQLQRLLVSPQPTGHDVDVERRASLAVLVGLVLAPGRDARVRMPPRRARVVVFARRSDLLVDGVGSLLLQPRKRSDRTPVCLPLRVRAEIPPNQFQGTTYLILQSSLLQRLIIWSTVLYSVWLMAGSQPGFGRA